MEFREVEAPQVKTDAERQRKYKKTDKGKASVKRYRHNNSRHQTDAQYMARGFIAWDGEGITTPLPIQRHYYTLMANSAGETIQDDNGLSTHAIFDMLLNTKATGIHVIYGGSYDFNMWLSDVPKDKLDRLYETGAVYWQQYRIAWRRGKSFTVKDRETDISITIYDVVSFFQCPFVKACDDYLGDRFIERDMIVKNKAARGSFTVEDNADVSKYNQAELQNLVNLMTELRQRLNKVGLRPRRWDGPGAIASALLQREGIKKAMAVCPDPVAEAARYAYFGGRFEVIKTGSVSGPAYEYDVNSAYPAALRHVPNLNMGTWKRTRKLPNSDEVFALYHLRYTADIQSNYARPHPLPVRYGRGFIAYPWYSEGWYWGPEARVAAEYVAQLGGELEILGGWRFYPSTDEKPFAFIDPMYLKRQALKKAKDGAHVGLKLGLNSLYGKTCQRVGARPPQHEGQEWKTPPFHQLEWAGYTTAWCRATVLRAALRNIDSVIAFETDALFTADSLGIEDSSALGEWEATEFEELTYIQSGFYFGTVDGKPIEKTRGVDRGSMVRSHVEERLLEPLAENRYASAQLTRFIGIGLVRQLNDWERWQCWETAPKNIQLTPQGKRSHDECDNCDDSPGVNRGVWHLTYPPFGQRMISLEYPIPWINPNPDMTELDEWASLHREEMAADYE